MKLPILVAGTIALALTSLSSRGATFTVANGDVPGLIAALNATNTNGQDDTINLGSGTFVLTTVNNSSPGGPTGLPMITGDNGHSLAINGSGALIARSSTSEIPAFRLLYVANGANVTVSGITFHRGKAAGAFDPDCTGGGILNQGALAMSDCTLSDNDAVGSFQDAGAGGAIYNDGSGPYEGKLTITNCVFRANSGTTSYDGGYGSGGAIYNDSGPVTLTNTTLSSNFVTKTGSAGGGADGGAIVNDAGEMLLRNCTLNSNVAVVNGGAINNLPSPAFGGGGSLTVINSTFSRNVSGRSGGGIDNASSLTLTNCTIARNDVASDGGEGGGVYTFTGSLKIQNTIIAGNTINGGTTAAADVYGRSSSVDSKGHNFIGVPDASGTWVPGDITGTTTAPRDPKLLALAANGGPTETMALDPASEAVNAGDNAVLTAPLNITSDQRLFIRKAGTAVDIGAFELGAIVQPRGDFNGDGFTDFVLLNREDQKTAIWFLQGKAFVVGRYGPTLPPGWAVISAADIDRDGGQDYLLFNATTRRTAIWFLRNSTLVAGAFGPTLPANWMLIAAVDFNRDTQPDFVLFNPATRQTAIWFMRGAVFMSSVYGPTLPSGWTLVDACEFNMNDRPNTPDFVLFNPGTRRTAIWYLNSTAFSSSAYGPTLPAGLTLQGAADFASDGKPDLVLSEPATRRTAIWYLNGPAFITGAYGPTLASGYQLASP